MSNKWIAYAFCIISFGNIYAEANKSEPTAQYEFYGKHFIASYKECDSQALKNVSELVKALGTAVESSGATILSSDYKIFDGNGLTAVYVLSESHASIHTYPEYKACFVDLFTCGHTCSYEKFDAIMRTYLCPQEVKTKVEIRD